MARGGILSKIDITIVIVTGIVILFGLLGIFSATYQQNLDSFYDQLTWAVFGSIFFLLAAFVPMRIIYALAYPLYALGILLLIATLLVHAPGVKAQRWIHFFGFYIQPSEFAKISTVLALARFLAESKVMKNDLKDIAIAFAMVLVPVFLIFEQPDLGSCLPYIGMIIPLLFWAGLPYFTTFALVAPALSLMVIIFGNPWVFIAWMLLIGLILYMARQDIFVAMWNYVINIGMGILAPILWNKLKPYQQKRIITFLDPTQDPQKDGYQVLQSQTAIGSGGLDGKGFLHGTQTQLRFLPEQHTDFIFSVIGEEFGFLGAVTCITCFFILIFKGLQIAGAARNSFASLTAIGLTMIMFFHVFINLGMVVGLMPVTGVPLPFMSSGGSALLTFMAAMGIQSNISMHRMNY